MERLFVAALPDPSACARLLAVQRAWSARAAGRVDARLVPADSLHLTLRYLGALDPRDRSGLEQGLDALAAHHATSRCTLETLEHWPAPAPKVVVLAGTAGAALRALAGEIECLARAAGAAAETRPFRPHVTLARVRACDPGWLPPPATDCVHVEIAAIVLMRSTPIAGGVRYLALRQFPLQGPCDRP